jgi:hypothetical protein
MTINKKIIAIVIFILLIIVTPILSYAHSGRTDSNGGHYNHSDGSYHYHHGYPEHSHPNGKCPYRSENTDNSENEYDYEEESSTFWDALKSIFSVIWNFISAALVSGFYSFAVGCCFMDFMHSRKGKIKTLILFIVLTIVLFIVWLFGN